HPCTRARATIRWASAIEITLPLLRTLMARPALKSLSSGDKNNLGRILPLDSKPQIPRYVPALNLPLEEWRARISRKRQHHRRRFCASLESVSVIASLEFCGCEYALLDKL